MKIAIIGTHGVGKTTLAYALGAKHKLAGENVKILGETARECPFKINNGQPPESVLWIYHRQMQKELEACDKYETVICDRSVLDSFMYGEALGYTEDSCIVGAAFYSLRSWMYTYDKIIFLKKGSVSPTTDGTRDTDEAFQMKIEGLFEKHITPYILDCDMDIDVMTSDELFKNLKGEK